MAMMEWAEKELERFGYSADDKEDGPNKWMRDNILQLLRVFCDEGHSGMSAPHAVHLFQRLASWKPLTPLTGEDDEWNEVGDGVFQNNRFSAVFKDGKDGQARWNGGIVFWEWYQGEDGEKRKSYFTSSDSAVDIDFPWTVPEKPEYRERVAD